MILNYAARAALLSGALLLGACGIDMQNYGGNGGVPLAQLDRSGPAPTAVALRGSDRVIVTSGAPFDIAVSGDQEAVDALRFTFADGTLGIGREPGPSRGNAVVRVTAPVVERLALGGSGRIEADRLSGDAALDIGGSGSMRVGRVEGERLAVNIAGSGMLETAGAVRQLDLNISGSGNAAMADLEADNASVAISGSGDAAFASDGQVSASIAGSGDVRVIGTARCSVSRAGSGDVTCGPAGN